jgi:hypothetical protein
MIISWYFIIVLVFTLELCDSEMTMYVIGVGSAQLQGLLMTIREYAPEKISQLLPQCHIVVIIVHI